MNLRARETFFYGNRMIARGQLVNAADPIVKGREHLFEPTDADVPIIEQATAAPGERRNVRVRRAIRHPRAKP